MGDETGSTRLGHAGACARQGFRIDVDQVDLTKVGRQRSEVDIVRIPRAQEAEATASVLGGARADLVGQACAMGREVSLVTDAAAVRRHLLGDRLGQGGRS